MFLSVISKVVFVGLLQNHNQGHVTRAAIESNFLKMCENVCLLFIFQQFPIWLFLKIFRDLRSNYCHIWIFKYVSLQFELGVNWSHYWKQFLVGILKIGISSVSVKNTCGSFSRNLQPDGTSCNKTGSHHRYFSNMLQNVLDGNKIFWNSC